MKHNTGYYNKTVDQGIVDKVHCELCVVREGFMEEALQALHQLREDSHRWE